MSEEFNFNQALEDLRSGKDLLGKEGVLAPLIKQLTEAALSGELEAHKSRKETGGAATDIAARPLKVLRVVLNWIPRVIVMAALSHN